MNVTVKYTYGLELKFLKLIIRAELLDFKT